MTFKKIEIQTRITKGISLTFTKMGLATLSNEAVNKLEKYVFDVLEDEDTLQLKFEENDNGDVAFRPVHSKYYDRYVFSRSRLYKYLKEKYSLPETFRLTGTKVEDGFIFELSTAKDVGMGK